ncbi:hypothetical protein K443DRAFT_678556 [Laccaria amethystina LaAM-08-1]|jgi:hypothetical protein|uniref:Uncharacterized protein n=1 Tax=Laccaria amethystina LaAM-08-1 TaxID=1095629 RepID=A0A0C9XZS7_9AGAR|nr:hypothetical protein K443DRAFT_678556 [Laccaria amethystina LaAM-08-1]
MLTDFDIAVDQNVEKLCGIITVLSIPKMTPSQRPVDANDGSGKNSEVGDAGQ